MDTLTIASSKVVRDTAGFPHGSLRLADVIDPIAAKKTVTAMTTKQKRKK